MPIYPNDLDIPPLQLRRAIEATLTNYVPAEGEPVWMTDGKKLYVGDGTTQGGILIGGEGATNEFTDQLLFTTSTVRFNELQVGNPAALSISTSSGSGGTVNANFTALTNTNIHFTTTATFDTDLVAGSVKADPTTKVLNIKDDSGTTVVAVTTNTVKLPAVAYVTSTNILFYDSTTKEVTYGPSTAAGGGSTYNQELNTSSNVTFNSVKTQKVVSAGGYPLDSNGEALILTNNTQSTALVVSNYTANLVPNVTIRGFGRNRPGGTATTAGNPALNFDSARGTHSAPTATGNGDAVTVINGGGYDGTNWLTSNAGGGIAGVQPFQLVALATEAFAGNASTTTNAGTRFFFRVQPPWTQLNLTSRMIPIVTNWTTSSSAPPTQIMIFGDNTNPQPTLTAANGVQHTGFGNTNLQFVNQATTFYGVPFEDRGIFYGQITGTSMIVSSFDPISPTTTLSVGQRVFDSSGNSLGFINSIGTTGGGTGTYTLSLSGNVAAGTQLNSGPDNSALGSSNYITIASGRKNAASGRRNAIRKLDSLGGLKINGQISNSQSGSGSQVGELTWKALDDFTGTARGTRAYIMTANTGTTNLQERLSLSDKNNTHNSDAHNFYNAGNSSLFATIGSVSSDFKNYVTIPSDKSFTSAGAFNTNITTNVGAGPGGRIELYHGSESGMEFSGGTGTSIMVLTPGSLDFKVNGLTRLYSTVQGMHMTNNYWTIGKTSGTEDGILTTALEGQALRLNTHAGVEGGGSILIQNGAAYGVSIRAGSDQEVAYFNTGTTTLTAGTVKLEVNELQGPTGSDFDIAADGTGNINLNADTVRIGDNNADAYLTTHGNGDLRIAPHNGKIYMDSPIHLKSFSETVVDLGTTSGTITVDASTATIFKMTLNGNVTINTFNTSTVVGGQSVTFVIKQDSTGSRTLSSSMLFVGGSKTLSTGSNAVDMITVLYDGTDYLAALSKGYA